MSDESKTPQEAGAPERPTREITVSVPEDRVEQFQAFVERFLSGEGRHRRRRGGPRGYRGPSGPGAHRHGPGHGRGGDRRERHLRRALFHLVMAQSGPEKDAGRCGHRAEGPEQRVDPASPATL